MDNSNKAQFKELFAGLSEYYGGNKPALSNIALSIYFSALERFTFDQVSSAVNAHVSDPTAGKFYPKAGDLIKHLEGGEITADIILASAKLAKTPLGILARIHIGSWDLNSADSFYLNQRARECLLLLPEWKDRAKTGQYTNHQVSMMIKHDVNPLSSFHDGIAGPQHTHQLETRIEAVKLSSRHCQLLASNTAPTEGKKDLAQLRVIHNAIAKMEPVK